jgi:methyl-accepting chemotaxis protein
MRVKAGTELVDKTGNALEKIVEGATKVTDLVAEIAVASKEQTTGIAQSNSALEQVSNVTQQNASNAEETAAASEEMSSQATELEHQLSRFKLSDNSDKRIEQFSNRQKPKYLEQERRAQQISYSESNEKAVNPEDIISLSDDNFGKY